MRLCLINHIKTKCTIKYLEAEERKLKSDTVTVSEFLKRGKFEIPKYQRSYAWDTPQLQDFWEDLYYLPNDRDHFFGNIVIQKKDPIKRDLRMINVFEVIDGQQRLATSLIFLSLIRELDGRFKKFLSTEQLISIDKGLYRLVLLDQDSKFFEKVIMEGEVYPNTDTISQKRLIHAIEFFRQNLKLLPTDKRNELLTKFLNSFKINYIEIGDDAEVASMFETINDRGKKVSNLDKTKSFLMYMSYLIKKESLIPKIYERFGVLYKNMFAIYEPEDRSRYISENSFQTYHWGMYEGYTSKEYRSPFTTAKKRLREYYKDKRSSYIESFIETYVEDIEDASYAFSDILKFNHSSNDVKEVLGKIFLLDRTANFFPLMMASWLRFKDSPAKLLEILRLIEVASFRMYAIMGKRSDTGLSSFVNLAHDLHEGSKNYGGVIKELEWIINSYDADDKSLKDRFDLIKFDRWVNHKDIKYLLYEYNTELCKKSGEPVKLDMRHVLSDDFQVEHILAQELEKSNIPANLKKEFDKYVGALGNLTLISKSWNPSFGNKPFKEKKNCKKEEKKCYKKSVIKVQQVLSEFDDFTKDELLSREKDIIDFALNRWKI